MIQAGRIGSLAFQFIPSGLGNSKVLVIGMNVGSTVKGSKAGIQQSFVKQDWALALSREFVLGQILNALKQRYGDIPPPFGSGPVTLSESTVCTIPTPFGCVEYSNQRIILENLDVSLSNGAIVFSGLLTQKTDAWYVPDISATFLANTTLSIDSNQDLIVSVGQPEIQLQQWYAQVLNFFLMNTLKTVWKMEFGMPCKLEHRRDRSQLYSPLKY